MNYAFKMMAIFLALAVLSGCQTATTSLKKDKNTIKSITSFFVKSGEAILFPINSKAQIEKTIIETIKKEFYTADITRPISNGNHFRIEFCGLTCLDKYTLRLEILEVSGIVVEKNNELQGKSIKGFSFKVLSEGGSAWLSGPKALKSLRKKLFVNLSLIKKPLIVMLKKEDSESNKKFVSSEDKNNQKFKHKYEFPLKPITINFPSESIKRDDIAVIIGNANYKKMGKDIPNVNPAYADAEGIKQYFMKAKGIKEGNIIFLKDATGSQLASVFGNEKSHKGKLFNYIIPKKSNVYIYYAGHGAPGKEGDAYLVPSDTDSQTIQFTGYQLSTLYSNLGKLPAKSVTVILEACFSGGSQSGSLISKASPIIIAPKKTMIPANVKVIAAGSERQMASWEEDSSHSLFTKYFLKAMSGEGDANKDGKVSDAELKEYLSDTMTYYARRYYGRDQKVQIHNGG